MFKKKDVELRKYLFGWKDKEYWEPFTDGPFLKMDRRLWELEEFGCRNCRGLQEEFDLLCKSLGVEYVEKEKFFRKKKGRVKKI